MEEIKLPVNFDGGYCRIGVIDVLPGKCDVCGTEGVCLTIDASDQEYESGRVCESCAGRLFAIRKGETP